MLPHILILAAGKGKRMRSSLPKVLHTVLERPMLHHIIDAAMKIPHRSIGVVVGHGEDKVREACSRYPELKFFTQKEQKGTGDAVKTTAEFFARETGTVMVLGGDGILIRPETLESFAKTHHQNKAACTVATARVARPSGYGRILRDGEKISAIREHADCTEAERGIDEINSGLYCFDIVELFESLKEVNNKNKQGEFYLTDVPQILNRKSKPVFRFLVEDPAEILGINDRKELQENESLLRRRIIEHWWREGVTIQDPATTWIDTESILEKDVVIEAGTRIVRSQLSEGAHIESNCRITGCRIGANTRIKQGSYLEESTVAEDCSVGPYAHLRPDSHLKAGVKIGNFVEIKKSDFAEGSKASHLSYIGDATIGKNVNLGCGFITCNYDGKKKHRTVIEDDVFIGSDSQVVAPVTIQKGSYVASGTTVTENVPPDSLVLSRGRQTTKPGYMKK